MKLRFLGQAYSATHNCIETTPAQYTAHFLGRSYTPSLPQIKSDPQLGLIKKYRGVAYNA
ncbi:DUF4278 domain-containing protein [Myxosarcina sp. GI1]|uniref:DUF4278 domain-containing protein n=1 Tax=Myxosarcina sp. GI1 TaxID=1541065 RepID=UPI0005626937|nr:DUF4278 domain-containing protein [Myxosarcina sp. GI1]